MGRYSSDTGGGDFAQAPAGTHVARSIRIIDIGTHHGEYKGVPNTRNQFILQWELPHETIQIDGQEKPLIVSKFYTNSLSEKANLRKDLESWRSRPFTPEELMKFDLMNILGKPCMLSIVTGENGKAKVAGVSALPKGMDCPKGTNAVDAFWLDEWNDNKFASLSEGFQKLIMQSDEYKGFGGAPSSNGKAADGIDEDDIPF